jgi:hypothetical protein
MFPFIVVSIGHLDNFCHFTVAVVYDVFGLCTYLLYFAKLYDILNSHITLVEIVTVVEAT